MDINVVIPAEAWPEWADRHCWDECGAGHFYGIKCAPGGVSLWSSWDQPSFIPLPPGHDWRVPVIRHQPVDLEQFRRIADFALDRSTSEDDMTAAYALLAMIDAQTKP